MSRRRFNQRMNVLEWSHYKHPRAANSVVDGGVWPKFKLIQVLMVVLVTCKNKDDPFKNEGAGVVTIFLLLLVYEDFSIRSRQLLLRTPSGRHAFQGSVVIDLFIVTPIVGVCNCSMCCA